MEPLADQHIHPGNRTQGSSLTTVPVSNDQGSWAGLHVEFAGFVGKETLQLVTEERKALPTPEQRLDFTALEAGDASEAIDVTPSGAAF